VRLTFGELERETRTGVEGNFSIEKLGVGEWRAEVAAPGHVTERFTVTIPHPANDRYFEPYSVVGAHPMLAPPVYAVLAEQDVSTVPVTLLRRFEIGEGTLTYDAFDRTAGGAVTGHFEGMMYLSTADEP
jgi:hypothetical protein